MYLEHAALVVEDYDRAIEFFTGALGFDLVENSPALTTEGGRPKRWVVVRPPGPRPGCCWPRRMAPTSGRPWAIRRPGGSGSSCAWTTSPPPARR